MKTATTFRAIIQVLLLSCACIVFLAPLFTLLLSAASLSAWPISEVRQLHLLLRTLGIAALTAAFALLLAAPCAMWLSTLSRKHLAYVSLFLSTPLFFPPYVLAIAWGDVLGNNGLMAGLFGGGARQGTGLLFYSAWGVALVQALTYWPVPLLCIVLALRRIPPEILDAGRLHSGGAAFYLRVLFPLLSPAIFLAAVVVVLLSWVGFAVPSLLQTPVYAVEIYTAFSLHYDPARAFVLALPPTFCAGGLAFLAALCYRKIHQPVRAVQDSGHPRLITTIPRFGLSTFTLTVGLFSGLLPFAIIIHRAYPFSPAEFLQLALRPETQQSLFLGVLSSLAVLFFSFLAYAVLDRRIYALLCAVALLPFLLGGPLWAVALITLWNRPGIMGAVYDSPVILLLALAARYAWVALLGVGAISQAQDQSLWDAARNSGASLWQRLVKIVIPLLWPQFFVLWVLLFVMCWGDLDSVVLLSPPGWSPLPLRLFTLLHYGPGREVALMSLFSLLTCALAVTMAFLALSKMRPRF